MSFYHRIRRIEIVTYRIQVGVVLRSKYPLVTYQATPYIQTNHSDTNHVTDNIIALNIYQASTSRLNDGYRLYQYAMAPINPGVFIHSFNTTIRYQSTLLLSLSLYQKTCSDIDSCFVTLTLLSCSSPNPLITTSCYFVELGIITCR